MSTEKLSLKAFWDAVEARLAACSAEELRAILWARAQATEPDARRAFLAQLEATERRAAPEKALDELLDDTRDLRQEVEARMEDPPVPYWNRWDGYQDEDEGEPYAEFYERLEFLFDRAQAAFDYGDLDLAARAYAALLEVLALEDKYERSLQVYGVPGVVPEETMARYLRALYEITPLTERPAVLYAELSCRRYRFSFPRLTLRLEDLVQITPRTLPDREPFLEAWIAYLRSVDPPPFLSGSVDAWLREAVRMQEGVGGLAALARAEGIRRPLVYLDWLRELEAQGKTSEVVSVAQEALEALPVELPVRAQVADHLCAAAAALGQDDLVREGRWLAFQAQPVLERLLDLRETSRDDVDMAALMAQTIAYVREHVDWRRESAAFTSGGAEDRFAPDSVPRRVLLTHATLLARDWGTAKTSASRGKVLGWSSQYSHQGLVVGALLVLLSGASPHNLPPNLQSVWTAGLRHSMSYAGSAEDLLARLNHHYTAVFARIDALRARSASVRARTDALPARQQATLLAWCLEIARQRVDAIVGNQLRGSYGRAAVLTVACGETLRLREDLPAARLFIDDVRTAFPRHTAFQRELRGALAAGPGFGFE